jgi:hypothetical protein
MEITGMDVGVDGEALGCGRAVETNPITPPATTTTASAGTNLVIVGHAIRGSRRSPNIDASHPTTAVLSHPAMLLRLSRIHLQAGQQLSEPGQKWQGGAARS